MPPENENSGNSTPPPAPQGEGNKGASFDINTVVAGMLQRANGDASKVLRTVLKENHGYRQQLGELRSKLPADGSVVLAGDDTKRWEAYRKLGDDPKAIADSLKAGEEAGKKWSAHETATRYEAAARAEGYNPALFKLLAKDAGLKTTTEIVDDKGKKVARAFVLDDKGAKTPLGDFAKANWDEHLPLLGGSPEGQRRPAGNLGRPDDTPPPPRPGSGPQELDPSRYAPSLHYGI